MPLRSRLSRPVKAVILQPSYIPWRGYFHQIQKADVFVFYDCVQYDDRGWRNRNKIKTAQGLQWLTIPVNSKGCQSGVRPINDIRIAPDSDWSGKHLKTLQVNYGKAPHFRRYAPLLEEIYSRADEKIADFTVASTELIARELGISETKFMRSSEIKTDGNKTQRLLGILAQIGATHYISGPSAKAYMDEEAFRQAGITVEYMAYDYPEYPQLHGSFEPQVTALDLLFNTGADAGRYIWG